MIKLCWRLLMPSPRECQTDFINDIKKSIGRRNTRIIGCASTGFGKSIVLASIVKSAQEKRLKVVENKRPYSVLIVLPRRSLVLQLSESFTKYGIKHGVIMSKERGNSHAEVQIASIDTYTARLENGRLGFIDADILLIDECHCQFTKKKLELFGRYPLIIGVTATPTAPGKQSLGEFYQEIVEAISMKELIKMGWLSPLRYFAPTDFHVENVKLGSDGDYSEKALIDYVDDKLKGEDGKKILVGDIYDNWKKIAPDRKTVIFCGSQAHAKYVMEEYRSHGVNAEYVDCHTSDEERKRIFDGMEFGDIQVVTNVGIISMGVSIDNISCIILAVATKIRSKYLQCVGRGTRIYKGKTDCIIIDHCGIVLSLGFAEDDQFWSLDGKESPEERAQKAKEEGKVLKEIKCHRCHAIFRSQRICPACGYEAVAQGVAMDYHKADLTEIDKTVKVAKPKPQEKSQFYSELLGYAKEHGKSDSYALAIFRGRYDEWPHSKKSIQPSKPSAETLGYITYSRIKYAKGKAKAA